MSSITRMPWGRFKGQFLADIETSYLVWVVENCDHVRPQLAAAILAELQSRFGSPPPPPPSARPKACPDPALAAQVISAGLRVLAQRHHPDKGGDTAVMQRVNLVAEWLRRTVPQ